MSEMTGGLLKMIIYKGRWEWLMKPWVKASSAPTGLCSFWTGGGCFESKRDSLHSIGEWLAVFLKRQNFYRQTVKHLYSCPTGTFKVHHC